MSIACGGLHGICGRAAIIERTADREKLAYEHSQMNVVRNSKELHDIALMHGRRERRRMEAHPELGSRHSLQRAL